MNKKLLFDLVRKEAKALLTNSFTNERLNLDFNNLRTNSRTGCVYGQMTGDCFSSRAVKLIESSCERVYNIKEVEGRIMETENRLRKLGLSIGRQLKYSLIYLRTRDVVVTMRNYWHI